MSAINPSFSKTTPFVLPSFSKKATGHFIKATVLSLGPSQFMGATTMVAQVITGIVNIGKLAHYSFETTLLNRKIKHETGDKEKTVKLLQEALSNKKSAIEDIKLNGHRFIGGLLASIPLFGMMTSTSYLQKMTSQNLGDSSIERREYVAAKHLLFGGIGQPLVPLLNQSIYPLTGTSYEQFMDSERKNQIEYVKQELANPNLLEETRTSYENFLKEAEDLEVKGKNICEVHLNAKLKELGVNKISIPVDRGDGKPHELTCHYGLAEGKKPSDPTIVLFHGNGMIGSQMHEAAEFYKEEGFNVLMLTMGGYPGSDEKITTTEASTIQDAHAVLNHLSSLGVEKVGVHGHSVGGSLAMHAANLKPDLVKMVILDKTFDNGSNVAANLLTNLGVAGRLITKGMIKGAISTALPAGKSVNGVPDNYKTDGLNNLEKVKNYKGFLVTGGGTQDLFMGRDKDKESDKFSKNFAQDLYETHKQESRSKSSYYSMDSGHTPSLDTNAKWIIGRGLDKVFYTPTK